MHSIDSETESHTRLPVPEEARESRRHCRPNGRTRAVCSKVGVSERKLIEIRAVVPCMIVELLAKEAGRRCCTVQPAIRVHRKRGSCETRPCLQLLLSLDPATPQAVSGHSISEKGNEMN
jgi:hypothetical protein